MSNMKCFEALESIRKSIPSSAEELAAHAEGMHMAATPRCNTSSERIPSLASSWIPPVIHMLPHTAPPGDLVNRQFLQMFF